jgi:hypothetical protein
MNHDEIITTAINELKQSDTPYKMFADFSFMSDLHWEDDKFQKIRYLLLRSTPFEEHTNYALKFSQIGHEIANNHKDWNSYKKSLVPKTDFVKWIGVIIAAISLFWNIYLGITNKKLEGENRNLTNKINELSSKHLEPIQDLKK